jgi:hypothetical protein
MKYIASSTIAVCLFAGVAHADLVYISFNTDGGISGPISFSDPSSIVLLGTVVVAIFIGWRWKRRSGRRT